MTTRDGATARRICGALGCTNDADGVTPDGKHTCLTCADANGWKVELYE